MEAQENNKLISEFMGIHARRTLFGVELFHPNGNPVMKWNACWTKKQAWKEFLDNNGKLYNSSWDWLMTVVEKIETINLDNNINFPNVTIGGGLYCIIQDCNGELFQFLGEENSKISSAYKAIIEFIKWNNENN
jgi:hypothetical protein